MTFALIYHDIAPAGNADEVGFQGPAAARYKLHPAAFDSHLEAIADAGIAVGLVNQRPHAALTFDDGGASALQAADALEHHGWRGHFFVTSGRVDTRGFLDQDGVRELARRGHDVGSHSHTHPTYMASLSQAAIAREWRQSREVLGQILGYAPTSAAIPGGFQSDLVTREAAAAGYTLLMTSQPTAGSVRRDGIEVHGRYTVWAGTTPRRAAAYAQGALWARSSMWLAWQAKTGPKRLSPSAYELVRQRWAGARSRR